VEDAVYSPEQGDKVKAASKRGKTAQQTKTKEGLLKVLHIEEEWALES